MEATSEDIKSISPVALTPAEITAKAAVIGKGKANMAMRQMIPLSILAGLFIGSGALFMLIAKCGVESFGPQSVLGGVCFALGLICVIVSGSELFTGNCLMVIGAAEGKYGWGGVLRNWVCVWVFNFIGSVLLVCIVYLAGIKGLGNGAVGAMMVTTAVNKINLTAGQIFFRAIICNFLVCLAVWMGFAGKSVIDKIFTAIFPVMAFVAVGAEHCVANMFFLPMGLAVKGSVDVSLLSEAVVNNLDKLSLGGVFYNIGLATLGNIVGGAVLVGCMYLWAFGKKEAR